MCARSVQVPAGKRKPRSNTAVFLMLFVMVRIYAAYPVIVQTNPAAMHLGSMQHRKDNGKYSDARWLWNLRKFFCDVRPFFVTVRVCRRGSQTFVEENGPGLHPAEAEKGGWKVRLLLYILLSSPLVSLIEHCCEWQG